MWVRNRAMKIADIKELVSDATEDDTRACGCRYREGRIRRVNLPALTRDPPSRGSFFVQVSLTDSETMVWWVHRSNTVPMNLAEGVQK